jgi:hypothetical protein
MATHSKPNIEIWRFFPNFFLTSGDGNLGKSLHLRFFFAFWRNCKEKAEVSKPVALFMGGYQNAKKQDTPSLCRVLTFYRHFIR